MSNTAVAHYRACGACGADISDRAPQARWCQQPDCIKHRARERYLRDRDQIIQAAAEWQRRNDRSEYKRRWAKQNAERLRKQYHERYRNRSDEQREVDRQYAAEKARLEQSKSPQMDGYRPWTPHEDKILLETGKSLMEKAWELNRSVSSLRDRRHRLKYFGNTTGPPPWTEDEVEIVKRPDLSSAQKAAMTGRSQRSIGVKRHALKEHGVDIIPLMREWTPDEDNVLRQSKLTAEELARELGRSVAGVHYRAHVLGVSMDRRDNYWTAEEDAIVMSPNLTIDEIMEFTGRSRTAVASRRHHLRRAGHNIPKRCKNRRLG